MTRRPFPVSALATAFAAALAGLGAAPSTAAQDMAGPAILVGEIKAGDRIGAGETGGNATIIVRSPRGIGRAMLTRSGAGWPATITVRLERFQEIEHFHATAGATTFICEVERREGVPAQRLCRLDGEAANPPTAAGGNLSIELPAGLFASNPEEIALDWIDRFR